MEILIDGEKQPVMTDSLNIEDEIESRATASFTVKDLQNEKSFNKGQPVEVYHKDNLIFKGFIEMSRKVAITNTGQYIHQIDCTDMHYLADKRIVALAETNTTAGSLVGTIIDRYLEAEGVGNTLEYWFEYQNETWEEVIS